MPTYAYRCKACLKEFETVQKFADDPLKKCPSCKKLKLVRLISGSGLVFKGSGFYLTDYKKRSTSESDVSSAPKESSPDAKDKSSEGAPAEKNTDGGSEKQKPAKGSETKESDKGPEKKQTEKASSRKKK